MKYSQTSKLEYQLGLGGMELLPPFPSGLASNVTCSSIPVPESWDGFLRNLGRLGTLPCCCLSLCSRAGDRDFLGKGGTSTLMLRANVWLSVSTCSMMELSFASSLSLRFSWVFTFCKRNKVTVHYLLSHSHSLPLNPPLYQTVYFFLSFLSNLPRRSPVPCWDCHWRGWGFWM